MFTAELELYMSIFEILIIGISLSMDALAVSVCKGLSVDKIKPKHCLSAGIYFGGFQVLMPIIGYYLGSSLSSLIEAVDHWIAFVLLMVIGVNMIKESITSKDDDSDDGNFSPRAMIPLAIATSIDALVVGVTFAFLRVNIWFAVSIIGITTFTLSAGGVLMGKIIGSRFKKKAGIFGGCALILLGIKILLEHLEILKF